MVRRPALRNAPLLLALAMALAPATASAAATCTPACTGTDVCDEGVCRLPYWVEHAKLFEGGWLPPDYSTHGAGIDFLINILHVFMVLLFVGWGIFFCYSLWRFRARPGHKATYEPVKGAVSKYLEVGIVIFELVLLLGFSMPIWASYKNNIPNAADATIIRVVAEQFAWNVHYAGKDGTFGKTDPKQVTATNQVGLDKADPSAKDDLISVNQIHFPMSKPVVLKVTSKDVIHGVNIPLLRVKQDALPGSEVTVWFQSTKDGTFELACAQLCGLGHYKMRAEIHADTAEQWEAWLKDQEPALGAGDEEE